MELERRRLTPAKSCSWYARTAIMPQIASLRNGIALIIAWRSEGPDPSGDGAGADADDAATDVLHRAKTLFLDACC